MNNKTYEISIRTTDDTRFDVNVKADNILSLIEDLAGNRITFISESEPDKKSFTIYPHIIKKIEYKAVGLLPFDRDNLYVIHTSY